MRRALLMATAVVACGPAYPERATKVRFDPQGTFWDLPLPSEQRAARPEAFALPRWPAMRGERVTSWLRDCEALLGDTAHWGTNAGVFFDFTGEVDVSSLAAPGAVFFVDVDPASPERGRRFPLTVERAPAGDRFSPATLVAVLPVPGFPRRSKTKYAAVVTDRVRDAAGEPVGRTRALHEALEGMTGLRDVLTRDELAGVAGAAVFTTIDTTGERERLYAWAEGQPVPALASPWAAAGSTADYDVHTARVVLPKLQRGEPPYNSGSPDEGRIEWEGDAPKPQGTQSVRVSVSVPKSAMPAGGWPLVLYVHGTGGDYRQHLDRGPQAEVPEAQQQPAQPGTGPALWLAKRGIASFGYDLPLHGDRSTPAETNGFLFTNLGGDLRVALANRRVAAMELSLVARFALGAQPGTARFDATRFDTFTQSLGTTIGLPWLASDPRARRAVLSGGGGSLVELAVKEADLFALLAGLEPREFHHAQPLLHALQSMADPVDATSSAPLAGRAGRDLLMSAGVVDDRATPQSQAALAAALGVALAGPEVEPVLPETLRLAGLSTAGTFPLSKNGPGGETRAVVQLRAPHALGHHVLFNQEGARHLYTCFLVTGVVGALAAFDAPCP
ncbi:MAG: hypothetical protein JNK82_31150 [Myxococcaceae bacterium]|nr:hypothetical protein [Myxococcaceae bacterium]